MSRNLFLRSYLILTGANFAAQIPYYLHQYYLPSHVAPSFAGIILMAAVSAWFVAGYIGLVWKNKLGYALTLGFLVVECLFYLQTQIVQWVSGNGVLLHVLHPHGWVLFAVFGIGYVNFFVAPWFIFYLVKNKSDYLGPKT